MVEEVLIPPPDGALEARASLASSLTGSFHVNWHYLSCHLRGLEAKPERKSQAPLSLCLPFQKLPESFCGALLVVVSLISQGPSRTWSLFPLQTQQVPKYLIECPREQGPVCRCSLLDGIVNGRVISLIVTWPFRDEGTLCWFSREPLIPHRCRACLDMRMAGNNGEWQWSVLQSKVRRE